MNMKIFKWVSVGLLALVLVASLFFPAISASVNVFGMSESVSAGFFDLLGSGWFYALLAIVFELMLLATVFLAITGQLKENTNNALNSGILVIAATVLLALFFLISSGAVRAAILKEVGVDASMGDLFGASIDEMLKVGVTAWPILNILFAAAAFVCRTMYVHGTARISLGDVRAAATDVTNLSVDDYKKAAADAVGGVVSAASDALEDMGLTWKCPSCGKDVSAKANFCPECGAKKPQ